MLLTGREIKANKKVHLCLCAANMFVFVKHFHNSVKFHSEMFIARKAKKVEYKQRKTRCVSRVKQQTGVAKKTISNKV